MLVKALGLDNASSVQIPEIKNNNATGYDGERVSQDVATHDWPTNDSGICSGAPGIIPGISQSSPKDFPVRTQSFPGLLEAPPGW